jgi:hypothetical protein
LYWLGATASPEIRPEFDLGAPELQKARDRRDGGMSFVDTLDEPVRFTQGKNIGVKRGRL